MFIQADTQKSKDILLVINDDTLKNEILLLKGKQEDSSPDVSGAGAGEKINEIKVRACLLYSGKSLHVSRMEKRIDVKKVMWLFLAILIATLLVMMVTQIMFSGPMRGNGSCGNSHDLDALLREDKIRFQKLLCNGLAVLKYIAILSIVESLLMATTIEIFVLRKLARVEKYPKNQSKNARDVSKMLEIILMVTVIELVMTLLVVLLYADQIFGLEYPVCVVNYPKATMIFIFLLIPDVFLLGIMKIRMHISKRG